MVCFLTAQPLVVAPELQLMALSPPPICVAVGQEKGSERALIRSLDLPFALDWRSRERLGSGDTPVPTENSIRHC